MHKYQVKLKPGSIAHDRYMPLWVQLVQSSFPVVQKVLVERDSDPTGAIHGLRNIGIDSLGGL